MQIAPIDFWGTKKHLKMAEFPLSFRHPLVFKVYCSTDVTGENGGVGQGWGERGALRWMWKGVMAIRRREQRVTEVIGPSVVVKQQFNQMCLKSPSFCLHSFPVKHTKTQVKIKKWFLRKVCFIFTDFFVLVLCPSTISYLYFYNSFDQKSYMLPYQPTVASNIIIVVLFMTAVLSWDKTKRLWGNWQRSTCNSFPIDFDYSQASFMSSCWVPVTLPSVPPPHFHVAKQQ